MIRVNLYWREWEHIGIGRDLHQTLSTIDDLTWRAIWIRNHNIAWVTLYTILTSVLRIDYLCPCWIAPVHVTIRNLIYIRMRRIWDKVSRNRMMECRRHIYNRLLLRHHASIISEIYSACISASKIKLITVYGPIWDAASKITEIVTNLFNIRIEVTTIFRRRYFAVAIFLFYLVLEISSALVLRLSKWFILRFWASILSFKIRDIVIWKIISSLIFSR
jgi:hypothetical protein